MMGACGADDDAGYLYAGHWSKNYVFKWPPTMMTMRSSQLGNRCLKFPPRPCPVTLPIRAHII